MAIDTLPKIITILGVTASGKTSLALKLAQKFGGEIISADSRQVYKEFNIGTAKPAGHWSGGLFVVDGIPHHLIDCVDPKKDFTLADYKKLAEEKIGDISRRGRVPFLVGGTALYLKAVLENWSIPAARPNFGFRKKMEEKSASELYRELLAADPEAAAITGATNKRRFVRALEVIRETGRKFSEQRKAGSPIFDSLKLGLKISPEELRARIKNRTGEMFAGGLADEVEKLRQKYGWTIPPMQSIGYQEFKDYFAGKKTLAETRELIIKRTLDYAKCQMTWFKKDKTVWVPTDPKLALTESSKLIQDFLKKKITTINQN